MLETLIELDQELFLWLNGKHSETFDFIMYWISNKFVWVPFYLFLVYRVVLMHHPRILWLLLPVVALMILSSDQSSVQWFKEVFMRLRPCHEPVLDGLVHTVNDRCGGRFGFVSSHATNSFAVAVFVLLIYKEAWWSVGLLLWAALVSYSRIYLGVHYPGDVLGGAILGSFWGIIWYTIFQQFRKRGAVFFRLIKE